MKIAIIGGGATGLLLSYYLSEKHELTLYVRRDKQKESIRKHHLHMKSQDSKQVSRKIKVENIAKIEAADLFIICVKQNDLLAIYSLIEKQIDTPLLFLQNGMGHLEQISQLKNDSLVGVIEHGAKRVNDYTVDHLGIGQIKIASLTMSQQKAVEISGLLTARDFPFIYQRDIEKLLKEKLIVNAVINPITAIFNIDNGLILHNKHFQFLAKKLCQEAADVLELDEVSAWKHIIAIAEKTATNTSSMRADILQGNLTEITAISGYILKQTKQVLPYTRFVYEAILGLESQKGTSR